MGDEGDVEKCGKRKGLIVVVVASEFVELGDISKGFLTWISMSITNMSCFGYHNNVVFQDRCRGEGLNWRRSFRMSLLFLVPV